MDSATPSPVEVDGIRRRYGTASYLSDAGLLVDASRYRYDVGLLLGEIDRLRSIADQLAAAISETRWDDHMRPTIAMAAAVARYREAVGTRYSDECPGGGIPQVCRRKDCPPCHYPTEAAR